ncbi:MAG: SAM-dependent chlorinase/fluorinase [Acidobacteriota bacterium]
MDTKIITLTTDFGEGHYAGAMKGVILDVCPDVSIVDITHDVASHDILEGAFRLLCSYPYFPAGTVHLAVVDPGVGSDRRSIIVVTDRYSFVGPDNGIFSFIYHRETVKKVVAIESTEYCRHPVSPTFHGRDVFAPVAAWLVRGTELKKFGPEIKDYVDSATLPVEKTTANRLEGEVAYVDKFGNIITSITPEDVSTYLNRCGSPRFVVNGQQIDHHHRCYAEAQPEEIFSLVGSSGYYEIAVHGQRAADRLKVKRGHKIQLELD